MLRDGARQPIHVAVRNASSQGKAEPRGALRYRWRPYGADGEPARLQAVGQLHGRFILAAHQGNDLRAAGTRIKIQLAKLRTQAIR